MVTDVFLLALAAVACASAPSNGQPPVHRPPVARPATPPVPPPTPAPRAAGLDNPWARLQAYLPALDGADHEHAFHLVGGYAPVLDADTYWRQLARELDAGHGSLAHTCAAAITRVVALVVDDPTTTSSIGRPGADVRVFWMPLAHVAGMTVAQAIRAAGLVDGPSAQAVARELHRGRTMAAWIDELERSQAWFLPAGDDPSVHHRRIRGYAVAELRVLRPYLVYVGTNTLGGFCELATVTIDRLDGAVVGPVHNGGDALCDLAGVRELAECRS
jgi:hypothetical protein